MNTLKYQNKMKAKINEGCTACGLCEAICPAVFVINDEAEVKSDADVDGNIEAVKEAVDSCPVGIIIIEN